MELFEGKLYKDFERKILSEMKRKSSFAILSVPGSGVSYFAWKFVQKNQNLPINHILSEKDELKGFDILDFDFAKNKNALAASDKYFQEARYPQRFALVINTPWIIHEDEFTKSFTATHLYSYYYFTPVDLAYTKEFIHDLNPKLNDSEVAKIQSLSGGILRFAKFLAVNNDLLELKSEEIVTNKNFLRIANPTFEAVEKTSDLLLAKLKVKKDGKFSSELLSAYFFGKQKVNAISIKINPDLTFVENGNDAKIALTKIEKDILEELLRENIITREAISELKWGKGSYDRFSDQAINKTVQRLNEKLTKYQLKAVPKVGYKLTS